MITSIRYYNEYNNIIIIEPSDVYEPNSKVNGLYTDDVEQYLEGRTDEWDAQKAAYDEYIASPDDLPVVEAPPALVPNTIEAYDKNYGKTPEQIQAEEVAQAESAVKEYVQIPIDNYNTVTGTSFESVYNCTTYKDVDTYPHQLMCQQAVEWNALVWATSRQVQIDIANGVTPKPETIEEFIALLPVIPTFG